MSENKQCIMVVDDDKILLKNAVFLLQSNYEVSSFSNGKDALNALSQKDNLPDLILLDVKMPDVDGYEVINSIKSMPHCADIPVVFLTGLSEEEDELKGLQLGAADYIKKPYSQKILLARVGNILKNKETNISAKPTHSAYTNFTDSEIKVADLIKKGYNGKEIGETLFFSYSYVKKLLASMREKSGCETLGDLKRLLCNDKEP